MAFVDRFSNRVDDYARYRPSYPAALIDFLRDHGLSETATVMDAGSGTGILTELLLNAGATVYAVEPNEPMRAEAERRLGDREGFHSLAASAEATGLERGSVDLITAAQAFHWFDVNPTRAEWSRILRPKGWVALIWNERDDANAVGQAYRKMARAFVDNAGAPASRLMAPSAQIEAFFAPHQVTKHTFPNHQILDREGLIGRALSSSYWPKSGPAYEESLVELNRIYDDLQVDGQLQMNYITEVFLGQLD